MSLHGYLVGMSNWHVQNSIPNLFHPYNCFSAPVIFPISSKDISEYHEMEYFFIPLSLSPSCLSCQLIPLVSTENIPWATLLFTTSPFFQGFHTFFVVLDKFSDLLTGLSASILAPQTPTPYSIFFPPSSQSDPAININHMSLLCSPPAPQLPKLLRLKAKILTMAYKTLYWLPGSPTAQAVLSLWSLLWDHIGHLLSSKDPGKRLPQSLRFCCSPGLQCSVFRCLRLAY